MISRPEKSEYAPYFEVYVSRVGEGDIIEILSQQIDDTFSLLRDIGEDKAAHRYEPGKWSMKQVIGHLSDCERVFGYRALRFSRKDETELPGFEHDDYVMHGGFDDRTLLEVLVEFRAVRMASIAFFRNASQDVLDRRGVAGGNSFTVRALACILAGHEAHHIGVVKERYL